MTETTTPTKAGSANHIEETKAAFLGSKCKTDGCGREKNATSSVSTTTTPRLFGHRQPRPIACCLRGLASSQITITTNTPPKAAKRIKGSSANMASRIA